MIKYDLDPTSPINVFVIHLLIIYTLDIDIVIKTEIMDPASFFKILTNSTLMGE